MKSSDPHVRGYCRAYSYREVDAYTATMQARLFRDKISLILQHQREILSCGNYFFCRLAFASCSVGLPGASVLSGPIALGCLVIGWRHGCLIDRCNCGGKLLVVSFNSNIKEGTNRCVGLCLDCKEWSSFSSAKDVFKERLEVTSRVLKRCPDQLEEFEFYSGYEFAWSNGGLQPADKKRIVVRQLYTPVPFDVLIHELESGVIRRGEPAVVALSQDEFKRKFALSGSVSTCNQPMS